MSDYTELIDEKIGRIGDELERLNARMKIVEERDTKLTDLTISVNNLASSVETMCKKQSDIIQSQRKDSDRITVLEHRPYQNLKTVLTYIIPPLLTFTFGIILARFT